MTLSGLAGHSTQLSQLTQQAVMGNEGKKPAGVVLGNPIGF